jgi:hypothetical protein
VTCSSTRMWQYASTNGTTPDDMSTGVRNAGIPRSGCRQGRGVPVAPGPVAVSLFAGTSYRMLASFDDAEDAVREAFLRAG